jgi:hypothetical protein
VYLSKSLGGAINTRGIVTNGTILSRISSTGDDGATFLEAARIDVVVDGTPGTNDMPARLVFSTTPDGASAPTEKMRITNAGNVGIGRTSPSTALDVNGTVTATTFSGSGSSITGVPISTGVSGLGTSVATALAVNVGSAGAVVVNGGALGTPSSGTVTNLTGTASININGTVGDTTANTGAFTTLSATGVTTVQAGSAAAPAITTSGDTNTGIFFPAADTIAFAEGGAEVGRFDSSANFQFNSGYGSVATVYGCRAWVNFNGTAAGTFAGGTSTVSRTAGSTTATVTTTTAHDLITGNQISALTGVAAGTYTVTVLTATTFTITTVATTVLTAASITFAVNSIRASGNVSSIADNGAGNYTVNMAVAMPDTNYCSLATIGGDRQLIVNTDVNFAGALSAKTVSSFTVNCRTTGGTQTDMNQVQASVFR